MLTSIECSLGVHWLAKGGRGGGGGLLLARPCKFEENFVDKESTSEVEFLNVGSKVAYFIHKFVGNPSVVLQVQEAQLVVQHDHQVLLGQH